MSDLKATKTKFLGSEYSDVKSFIKPAISKSDETKYSIEDISFFRPCVNETHVCDDQWGHPRTYDGRLAVIIAFPTGSVVHDDGRKAELEKQRPSM